MTPYTTRIAHPDEYAEVGAITVEAYVGDGLVPADNEYVAQLANARGRSAATLLVAVDGDDSVVGTVTYCRHGGPLAELAQPGESEFRMLAVPKRARGNGIGRLLTEACIDLARDNGDHGIVLSTQAAMRAAHRIYEGLGFARAPERDWQPAPGAELLAYYRSLS